KIKKDLPIEEESVTEEATGVMTQEDVQKAVEGMEESSRENLMTAEDVQKAVEEMEESSRENLMTAEDVQKAVEEMEDK
ncbi:MAG: hypothetical protein ABII25_02570, partial [bacterium]